MDGRTWLYRGRTLGVVRIDGEFAELAFDREGESVNKLDTLAMDELRAATAAIAAIAAQGALRGLLVTSAKPVFIVGADIGEFGAMFRLSVDAMAAQIADSNAVFTAFEDLALPTVAAINGYALGGGLEFALSAALRVMSDEAQVGVPEVKLGIFPGFGGTVRLPRVAGAAVALEWVTGGRSYKPALALAAGVVDEVVAAPALRDAALALLRRAAAGEIDWHARQQRKREPIGVEPQAPYETTLAALEAKRHLHQGAAATALALMRRGAALNRADALVAEHRAFAEVARTQAASSLVQTFMSEQQLRKLNKQRAAAARTVRHGAVVGAGVMGTGIAQVSALAGVAVRLTDVDGGRVDRAFTALGEQLARQVQRGRLKPERAAAARAAVTPQIDHAGFDAIDFAVEAVVERLDVKREVLAAVERDAGGDAVLASNTSSFRIDDLAQALQRPQNLVGLHFFNPVPAMALVEVVRGRRSSDAAVATAVGYANAIGKTPVVVADVPGFLVNRVLTPYMRAFLQLVEEGVDYAAIDRAMEAFGWPLGPAALQDLAGIDVGAAACDEISAGYAERMPPLPRNALRLLADAGRLGRKSGGGFYRYPGGAQAQREPADEARALLAAIQPAGAHATLDDAAIVERLMLPLIIEAVRALDEGVVANACELDLALLLGLGFPAYLGGALKYADWLGAAEVVCRADALAHLGPAYRATDGLRERARAGTRFYAS
ncbi:MAG: enoyl-CoA hydratase/isomerase family protein [Burkholderiales bacterium]|nr:enoyl-CoA hydratase/isomerase family protein [Burkholderiales bacterium]